MLNLQRMGTSMFSKRETKHQMEQNLFTNVKIEENQNAESNLPFQQSYSTVILTIEVTNNTIEGT